MRSLSSNLGDMPSKPGPDAHDGEYIGEIGKDLIIMLIPPCGRHEQGDGKRFTSATTAI